MYELVCDSINSEFTGWKGGEFIMTKVTPCYLAKEGSGDGKEFTIDDLNKMLESLEQIGLPTI